MGVSVTFYNCSDDNRTINKNLVTGATISAELYDPTSVIRPFLRVDYNANYLNYNYMYIADFNRYYFIKNITTDSGGALIIEGTVDVLMSYRTQINNLNAIAVRLPNKDQPGSWRSSYIPDSKLPMNMGRSVKCIEFEGTDFNIDTAGVGSYNFVLNVAGGGSASTP